MNWQILVGWSLVLWVARRCRDYWKIAPPGSGLYMGCDVSYGLQSHIDITHMSHE